MSFTELQFSEHSNVHSFLRAQNCLTLALLVALRWTKKCKMRFPGYLKVYWFEPIDIKNLCILPLKRWSNIRQNENQVGKNYILPSLWKNINLQQSSFFIAIFIDVTRRLIDDVLKIRSVNFSELCQLAGFFLAGQEIKFIWH